VKTFHSGRLVTLAALFLLAVISGVARASLGDCAPFTDVAADGFCPFVLEIFTLGITTGTSPTTYDPRERLAAPDGGVSLPLGGRGLKRAAGARRSASSGPAELLAYPPRGLVPPSESDGWTWAGGFGTVSPARQPTGSSWRRDRATTAGSVLAAMGRVFVTGDVAGNLYQIDPTQAPGP
jgi:hypothetical protein